MKIIYVIIDGAASAVDFTIDAAKSAKQKLGWWFDASNRYGLGLFIGYALQFLAGFAIGYAAITVVKVVLAIVALS